jgi:uncharacterized membrane protein
MQLMIIDVPSRERGMELIDRVEDAVDQKQVSVADVALVHRTDQGRVKIHQTRDVGAGKGALRGGLVGALVGVVAAPMVAATAVGVGAGALISAVADRGIDNRLMKRVGEHITGGKAAVFVLADDASVAYLAERGDLKDTDIEFMVVSPDITDLAEPEPAPSAAIRPTPATAAA